MKLDTTLVEGSGFLRSGGTHYPSLFLFGKATEELAKHSRGDVDGDGKGMQLEADAQRDDERDRGVNPEKPGEGKFLRALAHKPHRDIDDEAEKADQKDLESHGMSILGNLRVDVKTSIIDYRRIGHGALALSELPGMPKRRAVSCCWAYRR